uniref:NADH-ubiquinone oxidoreductase chain 2 n=1 Tax=Bombus hortorum TaxID=85660 RepID=A0A0S2LTB3_BOMHO|nr:NADH dehydrogenase subunit 2 [Bombus hortorum]DBA43923.1 TPA_asm: ND2 [Bombus hortorum]
MLLLIFNKFNSLFLISIIMFFFIMLNSTSIYIQWLSMEFSTILMISMINIKSNNKIVSILYFMMSSISSLLIIIFITLNYSQLYFIKNYDLNNILMISMFLKIGIFPFCFWMIKIYLLSSWKQIFIISTFMKFIPIYFFSSIMYFSSTMMTIMLLNNIFLSLYTNLNFSIKKMFGCSSVFNSLFFFYILQINKNYFFLFMFIYLTLFFMITFMLEFYNIYNQNFKNFSSKAYIIFITLTFMYSMFPLFMTFLFKWEFIILFNSIYSNNLIILLLLLSMMMLWNYFTLLKTLMLKFNFYKNIMKIEILSMKMLIPTIIFFYSMTFLIFNLI